MGDGDRPRSGLRDLASPEWAKTRHAAASPLATARGVRYTGARPCPILPVELLVKDRAALWYVVNARLPITSAGRCRP
jgi:hypothetical protein